MSQTTLPFNPYKHYYLSVICISNGYIKITLTVGVYEYLVKSYQAKGDLRTAVIMMKRAIRYETPWDTRYIDQLRGQLGILEQELAAKNKKTSDGGK